MAGKLELHLPDFPDIPLPHGLIIHPDRKNRKSITEPRPSLALWAGIFSA
jgi:hypothetical protein